MRKTKAGNRCVNSTALPGRIPRATSLRVATLSGSARHVMTPPSPSARAVSGTASQSTAAQRAATGTGAPSGHPAPQREPRNAAQRDRIHATGLMALLGGEQPCEPSWRSWILVPAVRAAHEAAQLAYRTRATHRLGAILGEVPGAEAAGHRRLRRTRCTRSPAPKAKGVMKATMPRAVRQA